MMSNPNQETEVFRFVCSRPAHKDTRSIHISISDPISRSPGIPSALKYKQQISMLDGLIGHNISVDIGRTIELESKSVRTSVHTAFSGDDLSSTINSDAWKHDVRLLDAALFQLWQAASDRWSVGPLATRYRQLYDPVQQEGSSAAGRKGGEASLLRSLEPKLPFNNTILQDIRVSQAQQLQIQPKLGFQQVTTQSDKKDELNANIRNLIDCLRFLNSSSILNYREIDKSHPSRFLLRSNWVDALAQEPMKAAVSAGVTQTNPPFIYHLRQYYSIIIGALRNSMSEMGKTTKFQSGLFSIGPFNLEITRPWTLSTGPFGTSSGDSSATPPEIISNIQPAGVADLLVVRDHVYKYVGGEIGAIQNVLRSEELVHEIKRLDRTEVVQFSSTEAQTENDREESTATRFALNKESNDIIKKDSSLKAGVSITAYGPQVTVKGDVSYAENNSTETSNKLASQYSQDITSRATSKIIQKTVNSTTRTTISEFQELNNHSFKNKDGSNISGVYQWVNKISQCQMYNYGKRLLIDITIPEPAAFLMTQSADAGPSVANPPPLEESAADLQEGNYSSIAARYLATGIKPPGDLLTSISKSFKADTVGDLDAKPGTGDGFHCGGMASVNLDVELPAGYLAYSAEGQAGVRTGPRIENWTKTSDTGDMLWPTNRLPPRDPNTYISVAGRSFKSQDLLHFSSTAGGGVLGGIMGIVDDGSNEDTVGVAIFDEILHSGKIAVAVSQEFCLALSGTIYVSCIRDPVDFARWQQETYEAIQTAYSKAKMDYERARAETAISTMNVTTGNNPLENTTIISNELKKAAISFITEQNFEVFHTVEANPKDGIPEVTDFDRAMKQGRYMDFFEKAFEWENMTYSLYPYFWANPGAARVTVPARLGFGLEVIYLLNSGKIWQEGPVSTFATTQYYSVAQEILVAEADPTEVKVSNPWYTVIPTDLVKLRPDDVLPSFKLDEKKGVWVERAPGDTEDDQ